MVGLHCTCRAICTSFWSGESTSAGGQVGQYALNGGGRAVGDHSRYWEYVETSWIVREHGATTVQHHMSWRWHCWVFYMGCNPAGGVACQERHNLQLRSLNTRTENWHAPLLLISRMGQPVCCFLIYLLRRPILSRWKDVTMQRFNCHMCTTENHWHTVDSHPKHILTVIVWSIIVYKYSYSHDWQPINRAYQYSFACKTFMAFQFLICHYAHILSNGGHSAVTFQLFRLAHYSVLIYPLNFNPYSLSFLHFLIQLLLLHFHDLL